MKISLFWKLGLMSFLPLGLLACNSVSSDSEDEGDGEGDGSSFVIEPSSSSEGGSVVIRSSSSSEGGSVDTLSSSSQVAGCEAVMVTLPAPSNLSSVKNGDNSWVLLWNYERNDARPETAFVIEALDMSASEPSWSVLGSANADVTMFNLVGKSVDGVYYRVSAKDTCGFSKASEMLQISDSTTNNVEPDLDCSGKFELTAPPVLKVERVAPSAWKLSWDYSRSTECAEEGFVVQKLDITKSQKDERVWEDLDSTEVDVHYYNLEGIKNLYQYYRVAAKRGSHRTQFSSDVQISRLIAYSDYVPFKAPEAKARIYQHFFGYTYDYENDIMANQFKTWHNCTDTELDNGSCEENDMFEFQAVVNDNFPNHAIVYKNTKKLEYQFRWDGETMDMWHNVTITDKKPDGTDVGYSTTATVIPFDLCKSYAQVRIIWEDNEAIDTTEWSKPVGPLYNSFEYLKIGYYDRGCAAITDEDAKKACEAKPKPIDFRPCSP